MKYRLLKELIFSVRGYCAAGAEMIFAASDSSAAAPGFNGGNPTPASPGKSGSCQDSHTVCAEYYFYYTMQTEKKARGFRRHPAGKRTGL